jgi:hypothetical protein
MTAEQNAPRKRESIVKKPLALVKSGPGAELRASAKTGVPTLQPEADTTSATDVLSGGGSFQLGNPGAGPRNSVVATVTPGTKATETPAIGEADTGAENAPAPAAGSNAASPAATDPNAAAPTNSTPDAASSPDSGAAATDPSAADSSKNPNGAKDPKNQKESSSKKKKGLRKVVPW